MSAHIARLRQALDGRVAETQPADTRAAVAIVLRASDATELLLIKRSEREDDPWSGHIAFPGGREEEQDDSLLRTAVRETQEEIGLDLETTARLIGRLDDQPAYARAQRISMTIAPYVFELEREGQFALNHEVDEVIWSPIEPLLAGAVDTSLDLDYEGRAYQMPAYQIGPHRLWGLTYRMTRELFALLGGAI